MFTLVPLHCITDKLALRDSRHLLMKMDRFTCFVRMRMANGKNINSERETASMLYSAWRLSQTHTKNPTSNIICTMINNIYIVASIEAAKGS